MLCTLCLCSCCSYGVMSDWCIGVTNSLGNGFFDSHVYEFECESWKLQFMCPVVVPDIISLRLSTSVSVMNMLPLLAMPVYNLVCRLTLQPSWSNTWLHGGYPKYTTSFLFRNCYPSLEWQAILLLHHLSPEVATAFCSVQLHQLSSQLCLFRY